MNRDTQTIHKFPVMTTPAGPVELAYNLESGWFAITSPKEIPLAYMDILLVALGIVRSRFQAANEDAATIRSAATDDINAEWQAANRLAHRAQQ